MPDSTSKPVATGLTGVNYKKVGGRFNLSTGQIISFPYIESNNSATYTAIVLADPINNRIQIITNYNATASTATVWVDYTKT